MKKIGILNKDISEIVASMGHLDMLAVCDAGLPIPESSYRIDLSLVPGIPSFIQVVDALEKELKVQQIIVAHELRDQNPELINQITEIFPDIDVMYVAHSEFKTLTTKTKAIIRSGEFTPYANIILVSGVVF